MRRPPAPFWSPDPARVAAAELTRFRVDMERRTGLSLPDYAALHAWSVAEPGAFWSAYAEWSGVRFHAPTHAPMSGRMPGTRWFEGATLNYAENLLAGDGDELAVLALDETGGERRLTRAELRAEVARCARALHELGVTRGDRVATYLVNGVEAVVVLLACSALGAVFSSSSPDVGVEAALDRLGQIAPRVLFASASYLVNGKRVATRAAVERLSAGLTSLQRTVIVPDPDGAAGAIAWRDFVDGDAELRFEELPFDHPLAILYTSGTTGLPKCLVHRAGGVLLTHGKEQQLHCDLRAGDVILYYTSCNWMMWNWLVSALARRATVVLYEGGLASPSREAFWQLVDRHWVTHLGLSAAYVESCRRKRLAPRELADLGALRCVLSTGSPLSAEGFAWVYESVKPDVHLASISGGTDIVGCFALGDPTGPVYPGQLQRPGLGVDLAAFDDDGREIVGAPGELVCRKPLPSMPLGFWGDPDGHDYRQTYFQRFPGVWCHGDLIELTEQGGAVIHGRSDATLKPGGVRIGTAELYRPLQSVPAVLEALAAGKRDGPDVAIWLFVVLAPGHRLDDDLVDHIRATIKRMSTPHAAPRKVFQVDELPRTPSGKIAEIAVTRLINGDPIPNLSSLANPEALGAIARAAGLPPGPAEELAAELPLARTS
jgi:acetoacetyl-CoA synthetase